MIVKDNVKVDFGYAPTFAKDSKKPFYFILENDDGSQEMGVWLSKEDIVDLMNVMKAAIKGHVPMEH